jgi:hypothetical protein
MICPCCVVEECECRRPCNYDFTASGEEWDLEVTAQTAHDDCDFCDFVSLEDTQDNPLNIDQQFGAGQSNKLFAVVNHGGNDYASGGVEANESYASSTGDYEEIKTTAYSVFFSCSVVDGIAVWSVQVAFFYAHSLLTGNPTTKFQSTSKSCFSIIQINESCPNPCDITVVLTPDEITINDQEYEWDCSEPYEFCEDYDENNVATACEDYLNEPMASATFTLACREECEFP